MSVQRILDAYWAKWALVPAIMQRDQGDGWIAVGVLVGLPVLLVVVVPWMAWRVIAAGPGGRNLTQRDIDRAATGHGHWLAAVVLLVVAVVTWHYATSGS